MTTIEVWTTTTGIDRQVGRVTFHGGGVRSSTVFEYHPDWLTEGYALEPSLPLVPGPQAKTDGIFGSLRDSAPDRWGRFLLDGLERADAKAQGRPVEILTDLDYLTAVSDYTRHGALRLRLGTQWLSERHDAPPHVTDLPLLVDAAAAAEADDTHSIRVLAAGGGTGTGGANPKVLVHDDAGVLWMAKLPSRNDLYDVAAWEHATAEAAASAGIAVPEVRYLTAGHRGVLLSRRFDREGTERIPYVSAATVLDKTDLLPGDYLDLADALPDFVANPTKDLHQLWRRIYFGALIGNTDDHLRNHGFLRRSGAWSLSPAFDVNPNLTTAPVYATTLAGHSTGPGRVKTLMRVAGDFRLTAEQATLQAQQVTDTLATRLVFWRGDPRLDTGQVEAVATRIATAAEELPFRSGGSLEMTVPEATAPPISPTVATRARPPRR